jgi:hypothetical protein
MMDGSMAETEFSTGDYLLFDLPRLKFGPSLAAYSKIFARVGHRASTGRCALVLFGASGFFRFSTPTVKIQLIFYSLVNVSATNSHAFMLRALYPNPLLVNLSCSRLVPATKFISDFGLRGRWHNHHSKDDLHPYPNDFRKENASRLRTRQQ